MGGQGISFLFPQGRQFLNVFCLLPTCSPDNKLSALKLSLFTFFIIELTEKNILIDANVMDLKRQKYS